MADLGPGILVAGRYRLERILGEGGMGEVWAAVHEITGGRVALKFLKASVDARSDARRRFLREARASTLVDHPNVVPIRDVVEHADTPVLVMDLLTGETLAARLARFGSLDLGDVARIALQVIAAVGAAHEVGVIHRDLKPENVFLSRATNGEVVRVLDFGIAKLMRVDPSDLGGGGVTQSGMLVGTPAYMAPEQVFGERNLDHRVDIWAIGVILHESLTGYRPIDGENYGQIAKKLLSGPIVTIATRRPDLPEDVIGVVDAMLARERDDRLTDLRTVVDVLARYSKAQRPSFGPPRTAVESHPDGRLVISDDEIAQTRRAHDVSADTLVAGSQPSRRSAEAPVATSDSSSTVTARSSPGVSIPLIAIVVLLVAGLGLGAGVFLSRRSLVAAGTTPLLSAVPVVAPMPIPTLAAPATETAAPTPSDPPSIASVPAGSGPSATTSTTTTTTTIWVVPGKPPAAVKSAPVATASTSAAIAPPPPPPTAVAPTSTGGLVMKPPF